MMNRESDAYFQAQIFTKLSEPPVTNLREPVAFGAPPDVCTIDPGETAGAHATALQPIACAWNSFVSQEPSSLNSSTETLPSEEAQANTAPTSWGAH